MCWCLSPTLSGPPHLSWGGGRRQGTMSVGTDAATPGAPGDNRLLPVPDRGRGPGPSALQRAGLPEARGHPGAAQPVGEEDRAAQIGGGPHRAAVGTQREMASGRLCKVVVGGTRARAPSLGTATLLVSLQSPSSPRALIPPVAGSSVWDPVIITASEASRGGQVPKFWGHLSLLIPSPTAQRLRRQGEWRGEWSQPPPLLGQGDMLMWIDHGGGWWMEWGGGREGCVLEAVGPGKC